MHSTLQNERGQVDVWSEKCLPPGTVHIRLPRVFSVAKKLEIDYAPALVGFEFRNGRSYPIYDGIVVCSEFKDVILEVGISQCSSQDNKDGHFFTICNQLFLGSFTFNSLVAYSLYKFVFFFLTLLTILLPCSNFQPSYLETGQSPIIIAQVL